MMKNHDEIEFYQEMVTGAPNDTQHHINAQPKTVL